MLTRPLRLCPAGVCAVPQELEDEYSPFPNGTEDGGSEAGQEEGEGAHGAHARAGGKEARDEAPTVQPCDSPALQRSPEPAALAATPERPCVRQPSPAGIAHEGPESVASERPSERSLLEELQAACAARGLVLRREEEGCTRELVLLRELAHVERAEAQLRLELLSRSQRRSRSPSPPPLAPVRAHASPASRCGPRRPCVLPRLLTRRPPRAPGRPLTPHSPASTVRCRVRSSCRAACSALRGSRSPPRPAAASAACARAAGTTTPPARRFCRRRGCSIASSPAPSWVARRPTRARARPPPSTRARARRRPHGRPRGGPNGRSAGAASASSPLSPSRTACTACPNRRRGRSRATDGTTRTSVSLWTCPLLPPAPRIRAQLCLACRHRRLRCRLRARPRARTLFGEPVFFAYSTDVHCALS